MFELEVNHTTYSKTDLSADIQEAFERFNPNFAAVSVFQWEEHCTECAMPQCYKTCDLYEARKDGKCRRFSEGISPVKDFLNYQDNIVKISFKKWGALMATGYLDIVDYKKVSTVEKKASKIATIAASIPDGWLSILGRRGISSRLTTRYKKHLLNTFIKNEKLHIKPDYFLLEIYNPNKFKVDITFVIRAVSGSKNAIPFQKHLELDSGFHEIKINYGDIVNFIDIELKHFVSLIPNFELSKKTDISVFFGFLGFVKENDYALVRVNQKAIKIVAWDLDNTIWKGVLVEDGADKLKLMPHIRSVMETLDKRGIVNSVVSKNNYDEAFELLSKYGIADLIVFPKISWIPKSEAIKTMISDFNVGADTVAFIDDSPFEREEVKFANPDVRVFDSINYRDLLGYSEFNPEQSAESPMRRESYKNQNKRKEIQNSFSGDYLDFVKSCNIKLLISKANSHSVNRIQELVQRTNQMNFSGNRYKRDEIEELLENPELDNYSIKCEDKFGNYGTVGYCIVNNTIPQLSDLMFSCRIQSKRVEHAFLSWVLYRYRDLGFNKFSAKYNKTQKNAPAGKVFSDLGFERISANNNVFLYEFDLSNEIPRGELIAIEYER